MRIVGHLCPFAAVAVAAALPPAAGATVSSATVTGTDGSAVRISDSTGVSIRNLAPTVRVLPQPSSKQRYIITATGPDGGDAGQSGCIDQTGSLTVAYRGNGVYALTVASFNDNACAVPIADSQSFSYRQVADATIGAPPRSFLIRDQGGTQPHVLTLPVRRSLGGTVEVRSVLGGQPTVDGAFSGASSDAIVGDDGTEARLTFTKPGRYTVVGRQTLNGFSTPWSAAAVVQTQAPFELASLRFPDRTGPSFVMRGVFRDAPVRKSPVVSIEIGKGARGAFRPVGSPPVQPGGIFPLQFERKPGSYRVRIFYTGDESVARGYVTASFKVRGKRLSAG